MRGGHGNRGKFKKAQDYSGFGLKSQTPTPKSAQLASRGELAITADVILRPQ
jgi:hypothetical protein